MASKMQSLRDRQIASIEKILGLNQSEHEQPNALEPSSNGVSNPTAALLNENGEPIWKVLVFDNLGRDIISSVLRVNDLRSRGVTIHL
jgi:hypothetical protein